MKVPPSLAQAPWPLLDSPDRRKHFADLLD